MAKLGKLTSGKSVALALIALATLLAALLSAGRVRAFNPQPDPPGFGPVAIVDGETMRVNAFCVDVTVQTTSNTYPPGPCDVVIEFHTRTGELVKAVEGTLNPGEFVHLDLLTSDVVFPKKVPRLEIRPGLIPGSSSGFVIGTVETFDALSGKSHLFVNAAMPRLSLLALP